MTELFFIVLVTVHCLADYPFQGDFLANIKGSNFFLLMVHSWIWAGLLIITLMFMGVPVRGVDFLTLFIGHVIIDKWKCSRKDKSKALTTDLYIDQGLHIVQILWLMSSRGIL